jgi:hypothetical protein
VSARSSGIRVFRSTFFSCSVRLLLLSSQTMVVKVSCLILDTAQQSGFDSTYLSYGGAPTAPENAFSYAFFPGFGGDLFEPIYLSMSCVIYNALIYVHGVVRFEDLLNSRVGQLRWRQVRSRAIPRKQNLLPKTGSRE